MQSPQRSFLILLFLSSQRRLTSSNLRFHSAKTIKYLSIIIHYEEFDYLLLITYCLFKIPKVLI